MSYFQHYAMDYVLIKVLQSRACLFGEPLTARVCVLAAILWEWLIISRKNLLKLIFLSQNCIQGNLCN